MRVAMFEGYRGPGDGQAIVVRRRRLAGFGALTAAQLSMADDAVAAAERGRSVWEIWKPSLEEIRAMRGWLGDSRVGEATLNVFLEKAHSAMGDAEWNAFLSKWAGYVNASRTAYDNATQITLPNPFPKIGSAGKWIVIGLVAYAAIRAMGYFPPSRSR